MELITQERLRELLVYDPSTGDFTWLSHRGRLARVGSRAGSIDTYGHRQIKVDGRTYGAHRLAFLYVTGEWPSATVDHINLDRADNRWANLREATLSENCVNRHRVNRVGDGRRGVLKIGHRYQASISFRENGRKVRSHLGMFNTADEAHAAYMVAAKARHGDFLPAKN